MSNKFSRDMEDQADRVGLYYAYDAGYDVRESPKLWRKLIGSYRETALGIALYVDHPAMLERLKESRREVVLNYANADFSEVVVGREKFVAGVGSYFGWIGEPPQLKKRVDNLPITKKQLITKTQSTKKTQPLKKTPVKTKTAIVKKIPKAAIRRINFRNFTYDSVDNGFENLQGGTTGSGKKTVFRLGKHIVKDDVKSLVGKISYADFNDDGVEEAFVIISSERPAAGTYWSADFYVFEYRAGKAVQIFHRGIYKVYGIELVGKKITTNAPFWRKDDAHCCPFATEDAVYEWQNGGFVRTSQNFKPLE